MKRFAAFSFLLCFSLLGHAATLALKGSVGYSHIVTSVIVAADNISNTGASPSGQVRLELWATPTPYSGSFAGGYPLAQYPIGTIAAGASVYRHQLRVADLDQPAGGNLVRRDGRDRV